jgi:hypothetical protein
MIVITYAERVSTMLFLDTHDAPNGTRKSNNLGMPINGSCLMFLPYASDRGSDGAACAEGKCQNKIIER